MRSLSRAADILADRSKYDPHTKETADHSLPYVLAAALVGRNVTPAQLTDERVGDPTIRARRPEVVVEADEAIDRAFPAMQKVVVTVTTTSG